MKSQKPILHGRDHCLGGADPIPCLAAALGLSWAWVGTQIVTVTSTSFGGVNVVDMDPGAGFNFYTNDTSVFDNPAAPTNHGITALVSGVYVAWGYAGFSRNAAIAHGTKRAWMILNAPSFGYLAAFDIGVTTALNVNVAGTIDANPQAWETFDMTLVDLDGTASVPNQTTWTISVGQESGGNANCLPALFVIRISDTIGGFV